MKLSEMNVDQLTEVLIELVDPLCTLLEDSEVQQALRRLTESGLTRLPPAEAWRMLIADLTPVLLQRRREEVLRVAAPLLGQTVETLRAMNGLALIRALCGCWDEELADFFACAADMVGKPC